ncbi:MAG: DUF4301 family protein [Smithella sp.]|jgi:hypothetical protein|nr:DUF4301 family protein [Smithella sp.]
MKNTYCLSKKDIEQAKRTGLTRQDVEGQLKIYLQGPVSLHLLRPCTAGDGIMSVTLAAQKRFISLFEKYSKSCTMLKFVPASGAASRMFAEWFQAHSEGGFADYAKEEDFYRNLEKMPFAPLLKGDETARLYFKNKNTQKLLSYILTKKGLNYGWLPKALIHFHAYTKDAVATALEEHLVEAAAYLRDSSGRIRVHLTVSEEHARAIRAALRRVRPALEQEFGVRLKAQLSIQSPSTNIIAVNEDLSPFYDEGGKPVFRPGGHGALLKNLQALDADFIFLKNIDNVVPRRLLKKILSYKKMLGGVAIHMQQSVFSMLEELDKGALPEDKIKKYADFFCEKLNGSLPPDFSDWTPARRRKKLIALLNRPLRVCGMVRNEGEPGGGPFWVEGEDATPRVQIVEAAHVHPKDKRQQKIWYGSEFFNPVDMVCCIRDFRGKKFDLEKYVDRNAYLIAEKMEKGRKLLAQELPGLWNGSMAYWNSVFVELPLMVFNPVKTVFDLLRPQHDAGGKTKFR